MGIYLTADHGAYAERVLVAGDPGRIARLSRTLDRARQVNTNRGLVGYSGLHSGVPVSVQASGMGCPSMHMVGWELMDYGARRIIRVGTCSAFGHGIRNGDFIVVTAAASADGTSRTLCQDAPYAAVPDLGLTWRLAGAARTLSDRVHVGPIVTVDVEPHLSNVSTERWRECGLVAVEMESAALFVSALRFGARHGTRVEAACILTVSDGLDGDPESDQMYLSTEELESRTDVMHRAALSALADTGA
ncbi:MAG: phosphorylase family protein [Actinomycetes bacterium]